MSDKPVNLSRASKVISRKISRMTIAQILTPPSTEQEASLPRPPKLEVSRLPKDTRSNRRMMEARPSEEGQINSAKKPGRKI